MTLAIIIGTVIVVAAIALLFHWASEEKGWPRPGDPTDPNSEPRDTKGGES